MCGGEALSDLPAKIGRPSLYTPDMGERVIAIMREGLSITAAAGEIGISRDTIYAWAKENPAFSDALNLGRAARVSTLERQLLTMEAGPMVTARIFALKNACPEEWREKVVHAGEKDEPVQVEHTIKPTQHLLTVLKAIEDRRGEE